MLAREDEPAELLRELLLFFCGKSLNVFLCLG
jgi:hypothetical protein